jgi:hypothetical protein
VLYSLCLQTTRIEIIPHVSLFLRGGKIAFDFADGFAFVFALLAKRLF